MSNLQREGGKWLRVEAESIDEMGALIAELLYVVSDLRNGRCTAKWAADSLESLAERLSGIDHTTR